MHVLPCVDISKYFGASRGFSATAELFVKKGLIKFRDQRLLFQACRLEFVFVYRRRSPTSSWTWSRTLRGRRSTTHCDQANWTMSSSSDWRFTWLPVDTSAAKRRSSGASSCVWNALVFDAGYVYLTPAQLQTPPSPNDELTYTNLPTSIKDSSSKNSLHSLT